MKSNVQTRQKLINSAKLEFTEKGYMKASLRKICTDAGVTTGALYFFFKDKEDLFGAIVEEPFNELVTILYNHFAEDEVIASSPQVFLMEQKQQDDIHLELEIQIVHHLYSNYDAFMLLLTKSQGSRFESYRDRFTEMIENKCNEISLKMVEQKPFLKLNRYMSHWLSYISVESFVHLLTHEKDEKEALKHMEHIMKFIISGWVKMIFVN